MGLIDLIKNDKKYLKKDQRIINNIMDLQIAYSKKTNDLLEYLYSDIKCFYGSVKLFKKKKREELIIKYRTMVGNINFEYEESLDKLRGSLTNESKTEFLHRYISMAYNYIIPSEGFIIRNVIPIFIYLK
jgi:hypothetical protein